ncbi:NUDIX domain-containing protein [Streptomyces sp. APSN-46.1]|uniref:nucleotide triphosphate diphosphatase NUDT15 n=1 Tax=Streptomyces sp. APSN-46.1 TaxID=2929049 RepID=UPI001FB2BF85|nr:NUDIX domain-containing protein [Streptomyces sp. APSN-46.1]MCJ1675776.1 NUDIX domain-containing protein [Streptomyces sp. APSN-46.1]
MTSPDERPDRPEHRERPEHPEHPGRAAARAVPQPNAVVGVGLIVVAADGRVLLGQAHDGRWELPGGKVDPGEGFEQAAARELAEETALRVAPEAIDVFAVQIAADPAEVTRLTAAAVTHTAEGAATVTEPHKIVRWQWFGPAEFPSALYAPSAAVLRAWRPELTSLPPVPSYDYLTLTGGS